MLVDDADVAAVLLADRIQRGLNPLAERALIVGERDDGHQRVTASSNVRLAHIHAVALRGVGTAGTGLGRRPLLITNRTLDVPKVGPQRIELELEPLKLVCDVAELGGRGLGAPCFLAGLSLLGPLRVEVRHQLLLLHRDLVESPVDLIDLGLLGMTGDEREREGGDPPEGRHARIVDQRRRTRPVVRPWGTGGPFFCNVDPPWPTHRSDAPRCPPSVPPLGDLSPVASSASPSRRTHASLRPTAVPATVRAGGRHRGSRRVAGRGPAAGPGGRPAGRGGRDCPACGRGQGSGPRWRLALIVVPRTGLHEVPETKCHGFVRVIGA